ncbi:MAG: S-layer homology domain-containing protein [Clostridia bacterium]|nr:S-layer homology domain-containing protein [Clostridia bacterium]
MKKRIMPLLLIFCFLFGLMFPIAADGERTVSPSDVNGASYFRLGDLETRSDITVEKAENAVFLVEDGLRVRLSADSVFIYRNDRIIAAMKDKPVLVDGSWCAPMSFYDDFLCAGGAKTPSLFNGTPYFAAEVLTALYGTADAAFAQKLLAAVSLPASMNIEEKHINMERIFTETPLTEFSESLIAEMHRFGIENPEGLAYGEYAVINGAQTLASAGMSAVTERYPELSEADPNEMTVAEYTAWQRERDRQSYEDGLSAEEKAFAAQKGIALSDLSFLNKYFYGSYTEKDDAELKAALTQYYAADIAYLKELANPFADVVGEDWFFEDVMKCFSGGWMNGVGATAFSPNTPITRAMIVTILYRLEKEPVVSSASSFVDAARGQWYTDAVIWANANGIVEGYGKGRFGPADNITREQLAAILYRYARFKGYDVSAGEESNILSYDDAFEISEWAFEAMQWAVAAGLINGRTENALAPRGEATRAEAAALLVRFIER